MNSQQVLREPHTSSRLSSSVLSPPGVGRGRGLLYSCGRGNLLAYGQSDLGLAKPATAAASQLAYVNKPPSEYEAQKQILDNYIPGLHRPGENYPELPTLAPKRANPIPESLISEYRSGKKNPVMVIHEYGSILKISVDFAEVAAKSKPMYSAAFACECKVGGKTYPQGVAKTKKDARKEAAKNAFDAILLSMEDDFEDVEDLDDANDDAESVADSSADTHGLGNKNPVMMLYEYCAKKNWRVSVEVDEKPRADGFHCMFYVNNRMVSEAVALNKKDAKTKAGSDALRILLNSDSSTTNTHWDQMARLVHEFAEKIIRAQFPQGGWSVLAGFVVKRSEKEFICTFGFLNFNSLFPQPLTAFVDDAGEVVAFGTGESCLATQHAKTDHVEDLTLTTASMKVNETKLDKPGPRQIQRFDTNGMIIFDSHAEVIARRALIKWLYWQIRILYDAENGHKSVFEWNPKTNKIRLKETVSIHMYISTAPCGDATTFSTEDSTIICTGEREIIERGVHMPVFDESSGHGRLRIKCEMGLTSIPIERVEVRPTFQQLCSGSQNLRTMSCSCKILKWNVLGLQGSLLSQFIEPVYMSSLTLGSKFNHGHLVRAICCRIPDSMNDDLPSSYLLRHPYVGRVSVYAPSMESVGTKNLSINWCAEDAQVEVTDALAGQSIPDSPFLTRGGPTGLASRLCKFGFHMRFKILCEKTQNLQLINGFPTYLEKKVAAEDYLAAKLQLRKRLESDGLGVWLSKPNEFDQFHYRS